MQFRYHVIVLFLLGTLVTTPLIFTTSAQVIQAEQFSKNGPYVEHLNFTVIGDETEYIQALQDGEIDVIGHLIDPVFIPELVESENIDVATKIQNRIRYLTLNTAKYPLNITAFRRALAFAIDKNAICSEIFDDLVQPIDSPVPECNPFSIEGNIPYSYYDADVDTAKRLLNDAGFLDIDDDGYRECPDGSPLSVFVELPLVSGSSVFIGDYVEDAMQEIGINGTKKHSDYNEILDKLYSMSDFDIICHMNVFHDNTVDWLGYRPLWRQNIPYGYSPQLWTNESYSIWANQLLESVSFDDVYEAATELQKIYIYECPDIILYEPKQYTAFRTDIYEGFVNDARDGIPSWWTMYKAQKIGNSPFGGTLTTSVSATPPTYNIMDLSITTSYAPSFYVRIPYDSLFKQSPDGWLIPWLVEDFIIQTHEDAFQVPDGYTRFTFDIVANATWSDGTPLTAEDIAFSLNYYREGFHNPLGSDLGNMTAAFASTPQQLVVMFDSESYWHIYKLAEKSIIPKHVFENTPEDDWQLWNPDPNNQSIITSGPFNVTEYVHNEFLVMTYNPHYFLGVEHTDPTTTNGSLFLPLEIYALGITIAGGIIVIGGVIVLRVKKTHTSSFNQ